MGEKKKNKKVNQLSLKECEEIISRAGGQTQCQYIQKVLEQQQLLLVKKSFDK